MEIPPRQNEILARARAKGRVAVEELASRHRVTPQTIRRDLNDLCQRGLLARIHGGAVPANSVSNFGYADRRELASDEKRRIGLAAAALVPANCSLIINIGTTTEQVARSLYDRENLVVITNNINVINILSGSRHKELILAGGTVRQSDGGIVGEAAVDFIRQFKVDYAIVGASALDEDGAILDFDHREVSVARTIIENARKVILVSDRGKFERTAPMRICDISVIDHFVTDAPPPPRFWRACQRHDVDVKIAAAPGATNAFAGAGSKTEQNRTFEIENV
ncbi:Glycerol-3-phosphate regulon repressor GlpR [hydrothermal vent metagenome]|uniref:Glycerol-3-phosphate regulon repressor GlpR n=1 Tax=hydrothermal vent metagenome TaxID=652676 RepID=A0A3B0TJ70_9ZZZZ